MPNLIVMPGTKEFNETLRGIKAAPKSEIEVKVQPANLIGCTLMLNTAVKKSFQCGGFVVGPMRPLGTVTEDTQQVPIRRALAAGILIDVTGQDLTKKGFKAKGGEHSGVSEQDTGKKVFIGRDKTGNVYAVAPKTKKQAKEFAREIKRTGTLSGINYESEVSGIVAITEEVVETSTPAVKKPAKKAAKKNVSTRRRTGNAK